MNDSKKFEPLLQLIIERLEQTFLLPEQLRTWPIHAADIILRFWRKGNSV